MKNLKKYSFTLIELIVAVIIVSIVITAIPALLSRVSDIQETTSKDKYFFNSFTLLTLIQTQEWDENNTKGDNYYKVLTAKGGDSELKCDRSGTLAFDNDSGADCDDNTTSHIGLDDGENKDDVSTYDDVDDFNGYSDGNLTNYDLNISVKYISDNADYSAKNIYFNETFGSASGTNVKKIELNVTDKKGNLIAVLGYYSCNIGAVKIKSRNDL
jgi:type II secretory pathway pseudopilin PulG